MVSTNPRKVFPKLRQHLCRNKISTLLGAENKMNEDVGILVGHLDNMYNRAPACLWRISHRRMPSLKGLGELHVLCSRHCRAGLPDIVPSALNNCQDQFCRL